MKCLIVFDDWVCEIGLYFCFVVDYLGVNGLYFCSRDGILKLKFMLNNSWIFCFLNNFSEW